MVRRFPIRGRTTSDFQPPASNRTGEALATDGVQLRDQRGADSRIVTRHWHPRVSRLDTIEDTTAPVWWPRAVVAAANPAVAYDRIATREDPTDTQCSPLRFPTSPMAECDCCAPPDHIEIDVSGTGGVVVVRRAYQPIWQARSGDRKLQILPADLTLTGVVVPPGRHRVELFAPGSLEATASVLGLLCALCLLAAAVPRRG